MQNNKNTWNRAYSKSYAQENKKLKEKLRELKKINSKNLCLKHENFKISEKNNKFYYFRL